MKCGNASFIRRGPASGNLSPEARPELPDRLTDYLTGADIPFSNRDNIRQITLKFLVEEKGFLKEDLCADREITFELEGRPVSSLVDISVRLNNITVMVWKCASGSLVSRERQIIASARLLEDYVVPFAAVTNGKDAELLDAVSEKVTGSGFESIPTRQALWESLGNLFLKTPNAKKIINEQRILYTYDAICCPVNPGANASS